LFYMNHRLRLHHTIVFQFLAIFIAGSLDDGLSSIEVEVWPDLVVL
jgi:hypothetical protein